MFFYEVGVLSSIRLVCFLPSGCRVVLHQAVGYAAVVVPGSSQLVGDLLV